MGMSTSKTNYKPIYQTITTTEMKNLERTYNTFRNNADKNGWTMQSYKEYLRIRQGLKDKCKEACDINFENKINNIIDITKDTKEFWNKIKLLKGQRTKHTNYLEEKAGNRYHTNKEKPYIMENTWKEIFKINEEEKSYI